jgi:uncharacterized protein (TIGR02246 family)
MTTRHVWFAALFAAVFTAGSMAAGSACAAVEDAATLKKIVADSAAKYSALFEKSDAAGMAALFTLEAEMVDASGVVFHGRAAIEAEFAASFEAGNKGKLEIQVTSIRPIADGVVVEEGATTFRPAETDGQVSQSRYVALHVRGADGAWLMAAVRELAPPELSAHEQLKSLAWLAGDWREEVAGSVTKTSWKWSDDGVALLGSFTIKGALGDVRTGSHRIGWDAERKQFRSWIFDSTGGFLDGWWAPALDGSWSVTLQGTDAEGARISGAITYTREGADRLTIEQTNRVRGGIGLPPVANKVVRQPPAPVQPPK